MQLQSVKDRFDALGVAIVAISQEEKDLSKAPNMARQTAVTFPVIHDVNRASAPQLDRTNAYFLDAEGIVRQIFPMSSYMRPSSELVVGEIARILRAQKAAAEDADAAEDAEGETPPTRR